VNAELHSELSRIFVDARHDADADIVAWMQKPSTSRQASSSASSISISR